jgi:hypothetical protein
MERVATAFGLMKADQERLGRRVPNLDLLIAATAKGARIGFTSFPVNCRKPHRVVSQHHQSHALAAPEGSNRNSRPPTLPTNRRSGCRRLVNSPRLFRVLVSEHDDWIAEILTGLIQMGAGAGTTVLTVETILEEDSLNLAIRVWEFRTVFAIPELRR